VELDGYVARMRGACAIRRMPIQLLAVGCLAGCGASMTAGTVPWADRPLPTYRRPPAKLVAYPTSAPACRSSQLRVTQGHGGAAGPEAVFALTFTNTSRSTCLLRGYPRISAVGQSGVRAALHPLEGSSPIGVTPSDITHGGHVYVYLATVTACNGGAPIADYRSLIITLPHGGVLTPAPSVEVGIACSLLEMTAFGVPQRYAATPTAAGTFATAIARIVSPPSARAGEILRFTVSLSNPAAKREIALRPCPAYTEGIYASGTADDRSWRLNCASLGHIPAGGHVRFAMELAIPTDARAGPAKLSWEGDTPNGPYAGTVIEITGG
jgi:hypothetical protein